MNEDETQNPEEQPQDEDVFDQVENLLRGPAVEGNADIIEKLEDDVQESVYAVYFRIHEIHAKLYYERKEFGDNPERDMETAAQNRAMTEIMNKFTAYLETRLITSFEKRQQWLTDLKNACDTFLSTNTV